MPSTGIREFWFQYLQAIFPAAKTLPPGVGLHALDAANEPPLVPSNLLGTFDVVHILLLIAGVAKNDP